MNLMNTASSKQRSNLRRAMSSDKIKLDACVKKYNQLAIEYNDHGFSVTSTDAIIDGDFPWSLLTG